MLPDTLLFREYLFADSYSFRGQMHFWNISENISQISFSSCCIHHFIFHIPNSRFISASTSSAEYTLPALISSIICLHQSSWLLSSRIQDIKNACLEINHFEWNFVSRTWLENNKSVRCQLIQLTFSNALKPVAKRIWTSDPSLRRRVLYPAELWRHMPQTLDFTGFLGFSLRPYIRLSTLFWVVNLQIFSSW